MKPFSLASCLFALIAGAATAEANRDVPAQLAPSAAGALPLAIRRPVRATPDSLGVSTTDLVDRIRHAKSLRDIAPVIEKLGVVGNDDAVDALAPLLTDLREGFPETIIGLYAHIDTEHAIDLLLARVHDDARPQVRNAAIAALGTTLSARAETTLLDLSKQVGDDQEISAVLGGLAEIGTDRAVVRLVELANGKPDEVAMLATQSLAGVNSPAAAAALRKLVDSKNDKVAAAALGLLDTIDDALMTKLVAIVRAKGDADQVQAALVALGQAGERALPVLRDVALHGDERAAEVAVVSIETIGGPHAMPILGELLKSSESGVVRSAAQVLANMGTPETRKLLMAAARTETSDRADILSTLVDLTTPDVDAFLRDIAKHGTHAQQRVVLERLLKTSDASALAIAAELATKGDRDERFQAMRMLVESPKGAAIVLDLARKERGSARMMILGMLASHEPVAPGVVKLLTEELTSGGREEATYAASELGQIDTPEARQALLDALGQSDGDLAAMAASSLVSPKMSDATKAALLSAARGNSRIFVSIIYPLVQSGIPEGTQLVKDAIDGTDEDSATQAVSAIAQKDTPEARQLLQRALVSSKWSVKQTAIYSLSQLGDWGVDTLVQLANDQDSQTAAAALQSLAQIGSERTELAILDAGRSPKAETRLATVNALVMIDDARTTKLLAKLVRDSDDSVAAAAIHAVQSGGPEVEAALADLVDDKRADVGLRTAAAHQLVQLRAKLGRTTEANVKALADNSTDDGNN